MAAPPALLLLIYTSSCGTALFSDGYVNNVIGQVTTLITTRYGAGAISKNQATLLRSLAFAGTVVGMLTFGYVSDRVGRKAGMVRAVYQPRLLRLPHSLL